MKKFIKILKIAVIAGVVLFILGIGSLYLFFPPSEIKKMAQNYVRNNYSRELDYDGLRFTFIGISIKNLRVSEVGHFEDGTFLQADNLVLKAELLPLLKKDLKVKKLLLRGIKVNIIKNQDGTFNFDNFISQDTNKEQPQTEEQAKKESENSSTSFGVNIDNIDLENSSFYYTDKQSDMHFNVENVNLAVQNFSLNEIFSFALSVKTASHIGTAKIDPLVFDFRGKVNLKNLNLKEAYVDVEPLTLFYQTAKISFTGKLQDFTNPVVNLIGRIEGVDSKVITSINPMDLPEFALPPADLLLRAEADLDDSKATIYQADLMLGKSYIKNDAVIDFSSEKLSYKANTTFNFLLNDIYESAKEMLKEIAPTGDIGGYLNNFSTNVGPEMKGKIILTDVGAILDGRELKNFNGEVTISSLKNIKSNIMRGTYNNSSFKTSLAYSQPAKPINIDFMLDLDKFTLNDVNFDNMLESDKKEGNKENAKEEQSAKPEEKPAEKADFGTYNIKLDVKVKEIANNVLTIEGLEAKADIKNFSNNFKTLNGYLNFTSGKGEIRDINKLMGSSKLAAAAFSIVKIIYQVFSMAKLDNLSLGTSDTIKYDKIEGEYTIKDGVVNLDKSTIVSNLLTVQASGTIDLVTENLNVAVNTHFGKVEEGSAFKPVAIKVKGTMSDPKYSVDVVSTVMSVLSIPTNVLKTGVKASTNTASGVADGIKGVASAIGNLF